MKNIPKIIPVMYAKALKDGTLVWGEDCVSATNDFEEDGFTGVALVRLSDVDACQTNEQGRAADVAVSDVQLMRVIVNACDSLHITRVHELGGKTRTIMEDAGLLEVARAVLKIQPAMPEMDLDLARAMCRSAGISLVSQEFIINFAEFYNDWRKGDFVLPKLAELDMEACFESWQKFDPDSVTPPALPDAGLDSQKGGV